MTEEQNRTLQDKFMLRMPEGMRDRIKAAADRNNRSMNAEIINTLDAYYPERMTLEYMVEYLKDLTEQSKDGTRPEIMQELEHVLELIIETVQKPTDK